MATILELKAERGEIAQKGAKLREQINQEKREYTKDELSELRQIVARGNQLTVRIETEEGLEGIEDRAMQPHRPAMKPVGDDDPDAGERMGERPTGQRFRSFGEQLRAVFNFRNNGVRDPRLDLRALGANEAVGSDGGYLIQTDFAAELFQRTYDTGVIASRCRKYPIGAAFNATRVPAINESSRVDGSRWGGVLSYWIGEGTQPTASRPKFRMMELSLKKLAAIAYASDEMLADSQLLESILMQAFSEEMAFRTDDGAVRGTGVGQMLGILNSPALVTVTKVSSQANTTIVGQNITDMWQRMWARSRMNAVWMGNQDIESQLMQMTTGTATVNQAVYVPPGGLSAAPYASLIGRPFIPIEQASTLGAVGDLMLVDWSQYALADKGGVQYANSMHVQFLTDEQVFRIIYRVDGQPLWQLPLTPAHGSNTLSAYVVLAGRP